MLLNTDLLILDIKKPSRMSSSKNFNQLWQGIKELKETMLIQNKKLDKLTNIDNKLNGIQQKMVEYENKLNQLEEEKEQLRDKMVQKTNLLVFQLDRQEQYIRRENILIYGVEENKEDNDDGKKVLFKIADEPEVDLEDDEKQRVHRLGHKRRKNENPRPIIARFVTYKKRNEFLTNKRELKNIEGRQYVFVCEDLTPLRYKLLQYMQKSCSDTFTSCYTRNGNIKAKLKTTENWVTVTSPDDLFKHGIDVDYKQMGCGEILNN